MTRPIILAIDPALATGFALGLVGRCPQLLTRRWAGDAIEDRYGQAAAYINRVFDDHAVDVVAIEEPPFIGGNTNHNTTKTLVGLYAIFTGAAAARGIQLMPVTPSTWRKHFLGTGNGKLPRAAAKAAAIEQCRRLKWDAPDDNAADAAGIFAWAESQLSPQLAHQTGPLFTGGNAA